ncbi:glycosyl hydrolase 115 family protein [Formosa haliotis]|uniref:glycosyl hydrolase 115 family protein n=1 Tax=Formosa haliotis TaxID=1555194 RepID=UPI0008263A72|nr:glycosyl hydrolase 115 family protein [Formosa haliotis]
MIINSIKNKILLLVTVLLPISGMANSDTLQNSKDVVFEIYSSKSEAIILYDKNASALDSVTANLLADDIYKVTNYKPKVITDIKQAKGHVIVIGRVDSDLVNQFIDDKNIKEGFKNQWESYLYKTITNPTKTIDKAFVIAGTNPRGTAYGVFNISKIIGVNPWYWWADVPVKKSKELIINQPEYYSKAPSVKYRGIFLNDEDWGLQPWAEKSFEPETGDIGPKTYAKIFELLLRLNANSIWPAMHPSTKAFFHYPGNPKMAALYNIVLGSSHAEPMLRNNVDEWDKKSFGSFNYKTNKTNVYEYWKDRVKAARDIDAIYTIGMRGVHDSGMEGVKNIEEAIAVLNEVIVDQRGLIKKYINPEAANVPQAFTVYKEVLDLYKNGLEVPEDITLVWTDDNYGYIRALSNADEQKRAGGGGVYYHASYWGRPHDYLWLSAINPYLIQEEMMKAYNLNNKEIWILNVGDIKPAEYNTQLFLDMAYDAEQFQKSEYVSTHQQQFFSDIYGNELGSEIAEIKNTYYQLAFERKPEFMGWSQTEKTTPIYNTAYNTLANGDEIEQRIHAYQTIEKQVQKIENQLPKEFKSSFIQLVSYPVEGAANMNKKFLYRDKAMTYAQEGRKSAAHYKDLSAKAYDKMVSLTKKYNGLNNGKWQGIMDMKPRRLPVFDNPEINLAENSDKDVIGITLEDTLKTREGIDKLPTFYVNETLSHFIDIYLKSANKAHWKFDALPNWITATKTSGRLNEKNLERRIQLSINWNLWKKAGKPNSVTLKIKAEGFEKNLQINISDSYVNVPKNSIVEKNGKAIVYANNFMNNEKKEGLTWKELKGLGHSKSSMQASPLSAKSVLDQPKAPVLSYEFFTETITEKAMIDIVAMPTHPLNTDGKIRIAVQWNDEPIKIIDFKTKGRSDEWKQNVLRNKAIKHIQAPIKNKGKQTLKVYPVDAGVLLDYFVLNTGETSEVYPIVSETINH